MHTDFYEFLNLKFKKKDDIPKDWKAIINEVDDFITDFLKSFDVDMDFLFTTNVGVLNVNTPHQSTILWDLSYWAIYIKFLEFVFWMESDQKDVYEDIPYPLFMKANAMVNDNEVDANRLAFLSTIFQYMSYKFYNDEEISYCFALLYNENKCSIYHKVDSKKNDFYLEYIQEQLTAAKFFCAFHEAYHSKKINTPIEYTEYVDRILYNIKTIVNSEEFAGYYSHDVDLVNAVRKKVASMNTQEHLLNELYADAAALDLLDILNNDMNILLPKWSLDRFTRIVKEMIENFYSFNTLTYELYATWDVNLRLINNQITEDVYKQEIDRLNVEDVLRGQVFPVILWSQIDGSLRRRGSVPITPQKRYVNIRKEMIGFFNLAYNEKLKPAIYSAVKQGFNNSKLTISEARDVLIEWEELKKFSNISSDNLFLKGGARNEADFVMFVRGY